MNATDAPGIEQELATLRFSFKDGQLYWELRSESVPNSKPKVSLVLHLVMSGVGEVEQSFPISRANQKQVFFWLAKVLGVEKPDDEELNRKYN